MLAVSRFVVGRTFPSLRAGGMVDGRRVTSSDELSTSRGTPGLATAEPSLPRRTASHDRDEQSDRYTGLKLLKRMQARAVGAAGIQQARPAPDLLGQTELHLRRVRGRMMQTPDGRQGAAR